MLNALDGSISIARDAPRTDAPGPHGPKFLPDGSVLFRLWAPAAQRLRLEVEGHADSIRMRRDAQGWHTATAKVAFGTRYRFVLPDDACVPDPASHFQPEGVMGRSELIDPMAYEWKTHNWRGLPWSSAVLYELHVGTFTEAGSFRGVIEKLDALRSLGVTALQIMPVAAFPGDRNWGYDGVFPYACASSYGRPDDFKALIDAAHARGLMVLLDVVYNHFGPEGNFLSKYAPAFFTERHHTPWGAAINLDGDGRGPVREFFIQNAVRWIDEFRLDGLRFDAVHALKDDSSTHFLDELATRVRRAAGDRHIHLVLENEENEARRLRRAGGRPATYTAQWNDDVHHVLHVAATGEACGYYADYHGDDRKLGRALAEGFAFQGEVMSFRGSARGEPSACLPPEAFVAFIQNHDQIGNRARGERLSRLAQERARRAVAAVYLLLPQIPMLFMGEEWDCVQPFPFFCDFQGELADAVRKGRRAEFAHFPEFTDPERLQEIPDPLAVDTFRSAVLGWADREQPHHAGWLEWYRRILAVRHAEIVPRMKILSDGDTGYTVRAPGVVSVEWRSRGEPVLRLDANLSDRAAKGLPFADRRTLWLEGSHDSETLGPWSVHWSCRDA